MVTTLKEAQRTRREGSEDDNNNGIRIKVDELQLVIRGHKSVYNRRDEQGGDLITTIKFLNQFDDKR